MAIKNSNLNKILLNLEEKIQEETRKKLEEGANNVVTEAKRLCPVGKTGNLRDSISWKWNNDKTQIKITAGATDKGYPYGQIVEWDPRKAKPFMHPAMANNYSEIRESVIEAIKKGTQEGANK